MTVAQSIAADSIVVSSNSADPGFKLVVDRQAADICIDPNDFKVVQIAADCLSSDMERVTGVKPQIKTDAKGLSGQAVFIGTVGKSALINSLIKTGKLDIRSIIGKWESFVVATVTDPLPGVANALVVAGSDRRGTAYGVFSLSEAIGVSPWVWWADVAPAHRDALVIGCETFTSKPPSVKYRGIFINDEDWGLQPWAAKTFEPGTKDIGPKTYAKVCELLLRLKANYLWPAMHPSTKAFNIYPENKVVADNYGIVMGSSHAEPMLRDNVTEWDHAKNGEWDYEKNRDGVKAYWEQRLQENGRYENTYTIGMRGIHDSGMPGGKTTADKVAILQRVIADQREMLARLVNPRVEQVPQIFVPYKEVLTLYQNGLKVPNDVTLVWPDDNYGYIRELPNPEEQKRPGGSGVYYHLSYWGDPEDYLWLCTTTPALVWEEMHKAYENGARTVWVVNVGDIKPAEIGMDFFFRLAWNIDPWDEKSQPTFLKAWAERDFGKEHALEIAAIMDEYYQVNYPAKPEHLLKVRLTDNEIAQRLARFEQLVKRTNALYEKLPPEQRDAFYELVVYPVRCSALMSQKQLSGNAEQAQRAYEQIQAETTFYNEQLAGGKWRHIMSASPRNRPVYQKPDSAKIAVNKASDPKPSITIDANKASRATASGQTKWKVISGLGRSGGSVALLPTTATLFQPPTLEYDFSAATGGPAKVQVYCIPTHALYPPLRVRYSAAIDGEAPKVVDLETAEFSKPWSENVLRAAAIGTTEHGPLSPGKHTLKLRPLDPGVVFDKVEIDFGGAKPPNGLPNAFNR